MIALPDDCRSDVLPRLYAREGRCFPLIEAVIGRSQRGSVFVDSADAPAAAFVVANSGFAFFMGDANNEGFSRGLAESMIDGRGDLPGYLLWYAPSPCWRDWLDRHDSDAIRCRERMRLSFREGVPAYLRQRESLPDRWRLSVLTDDLLAKVERLRLSLTSRFWSSAADFLANGAGVCLFDESDTVVSVCYSACVVGGLAETDVATRDDLRGQGWGSAVGRQFVRECLRRGVTPTWDCFTANEGSLRLAHTLGFKEVCRYPFYSFRVPLAG